MHLPQFPLFRPEDGADEAEGPEVPASAGAPEPDPPLLPGDASAGDLVPGDAFQARGVRQGRQFDIQCRLVLQDLGFAVGEKPFVVPELGVEFDAAITSRGGRTYWCEFKGSWHGNRPGLRRTDTVKKALADAFLAHLAADDYPPVIFLTTHAPQQGSSGHRMLEVALRAGALRDVICINEPRDVDRLHKLANDL